MKRVVVLVVLLVVVVGSGGYAVAQARQPQASYSTAKATRGDVERTLDLSGTVTATGRRDLGFGTDGTVARVLVTDGQRVHRGQVLARLDTTALDATVTEAEATLAQAKAQLASDEDAQASAVTAASSSGRGGNASQKPRASTPAKPPTSSQPTTPSKPDPALQQALAELATQRQAVTAAQSDASTAITAAKAALTAQTQACEAPDDPNAGEGDTGESNGLSAACTAALAAVQDAQDTVAARQDQLEAALSALSGTLTKAVAAVTRASQPQSQGQASSATGQSQGAPIAPTSTVSPSTSSGASNGNGSTGGTVTAARLAQDLADIDTAEARLHEAKVARGLATLRAPYAGRLLQVDLTRGEQESSSDTGVVLVGGGVTTVTATVSNTQVSDVRRGQSVIVTPAGWPTPLKGTVTEIALLPDSAGDFAVTVTVESSRTVSEGSTASVSIVTGMAKGAVTVPTSAVTRTGDRAVVQVLDGQSVTPTQVTVGVVGARRTSITQGLEQGATVVLADLAARVPSSDSTQQGFRGPAGGGGFGGGPAVKFGG